MLRGVLGLLVLVGAGCSAPVTVEPAGSLTVNVPAALTVFQGGELTFPVRLSWEGTPVEVSVEARNAGDRLVIDATSFPAGTLESQVTLRATTNAEAGALTVSAVGAAVRATAEVQVTVATAIVASAPMEPSLRGGSAAVEVEVTGGSPTFEGVASAEPIPGSNRFVLKVPVPTTAALGTAVLRFEVNVGGATRSLEVPVVVTDTVTVRVFDYYGDPLELHEVFVNDSGPRLTDGQGQAAFTGITAPYRLTVRRFLSGIDAHTYDGVTVVSPIVNGYEARYAQKSTTLDVRLEEGNTRNLISGHQSAIVMAFMEGQPPGSAVNFIQGSATASGPIYWRSLNAMPPAKLRAVAWQDGKLSRYADMSLTLRENETRTLNFQMGPVAVGDIHTSLQVPAGFSLVAKSLHAIFAGNRFDVFGVDSDSSPALQATLNGALRRDDVTHNLAVTALDLAGRRISRTFPNLQIGETATGALADAPRMQNVSTSAINHATRYQWTDGGWPIYELSLRVGQGPDLRIEVLYTSAKTLTRSGRVVFPNGATGTYRICGSSYYRSVDELLSDPIANIERNLLRSGAAGCDVTQPVTYTTTP